MVEDYEKLLERAMANLPEEVLKTARFETPKVVGHIQGQRTVISNIHQIATALNREIADLVKYLLRELATPGEIKQKGLILGRKISAGRVNEKIRQFTREFVLCKECGKPDTKVVRENRILFLRCLACGARNPISAKL